VERISAWCCGIREFGTPRETAEDRTNRGRGVTRLSPCARDAPWVRNYLKAAAMAK
jgi:hypothetical protein